MQTDSHWAKCDWCGSGANISYFTVIRCLNVETKIEHELHRCKPCGRKENRRADERLRTLAKRLSTKGD